MPSFYEFLLWPVEIVCPAFTNIGQETKYIGIRQVYFPINKTNWTDLISATGLMISFGICDIEIVHRTLENIKTLLCHTKLWVAFHSYLRIETRVIIYKRWNRDHTGNWNWTWRWKRTRHLFYVPRGFMTISWSFAHWNRSYRLETQKSSPILVTLWPVWP